MERPTGEGFASGSSLVPAVSSLMPQINAPAVNLAGLTPTPGTVDQVIFYQPVPEYFQFAHKQSDVSG